MNVPAVHSDSPLRDGEPKAHSTCLTRPGIVDPIEAIEDIRGMFRCYPWAAVDNFQENGSRGLGVDYDMNRPAGR